MAWSTVRSGSSITAATPGDCSVEFAADTLIGRNLWTTGAFEPCELDAAFGMSSPGTYTFDVGANVGLFTVVMSRGVGPDGRVEPVANTLGCLRSNLERNQCTNVEVVEGAAADSPGEIGLLMTDDPAFHSAGGKLMPGHPLVRTVRVKAYTLDAVWIAAGRPPVSLVKIDVEGGEQAVLLGAAQMIQHCRPAVIIEVADPQELSQIAALLHGYRQEPAAGFEPYNYLMVSE